MLKKKCTVVLLFLFFNLLYAQRAQICQGLDRYFIDKGYPLHLSPTRGCIAIESGFIENIYRYGAHDMPFVGLVKKLFYMDPDDGLLVPTSYKPFNNFNFEGIAEVVALLECREKLSREKCDNVKGNEKRINELFGLVNSVMKGNGKNFKSTILAQSIFLALLYQKAKNQKDLYSYSEELFKILSQKKNFLKIKNNDQSPIDELSEISFRSLQERSPGLVYPPYNMWRSAVSFCKNKNFSDCCETALLNLLALTLYDSKMRCYSFSSGCEKKIKKNFYDFWLKYASSLYKDVSDKKAHCRWAGLTSGLSGVLYRKEFEKTNYEIAPSLKNFVTVLHSFLISEELFVPDIVEPQMLCDVLKKYNTAAETSIAGSVIRADNDCDIRIVFPESRVATLYIRKDHAWVIFDTPRINYAQLGRQFLEYSVTNTIINQKFHYAIPSLYAIVSKKEELSPLERDVYMLYAAALRKSGIKNESIHNDLTYYFCYPKKSDQEKLRILNELRTEPQATLFFSLEALCKDVKENGLLERMRLSPLDTECCVSDHPIVLRFGTDQVTPNCCHENSNYHSCFCYPCSGKCVESGILD